MSSRIPDRILFLAVTTDGKVIGFVIHPKSELASEYLNLSELPVQGIFSCIDITKQEDNLTMLLYEFRRINSLGWIDSKRLDRDGKILPCNAPNCGGYTLEAELRITPNGFSEPDFLGWEIKQFNVTNFERLSNSIITLMTPEPTNGIYVSEGVEAFVRKYGYIDKLGRQNRMNFGGIHKSSLENPILI